MRRLVMIGCAALALIGGGSMPSYLQDAKLQKELDALTKRGYTYKFLDNNLVEITNPMTSTKQLKSLNQPSEAEIRVWAASRGVPILEIDPRTIDTSRYMGWFTYWTTVPLSNSDGIPLVVADADRDGKADVYGGYHAYTSEDYGARVYEIDSNGNIELGYDYVPRPGASIAVADVDRDSKTEVLWRLGGGIYDYEQTNRNSLPTHLRFRHERYQGNVTAGYTGMYFGFLDSDTLTDFIYKGSELDSSDTTLGISKVYVTEFNQDTNNFCRVWSKQFVIGQQASTEGFGVEDFDRDGNMEFALSEGFQSWVFISENAGDNRYEQVWQDSTPFVNLSFHASGDVDGDGWPELFVAATMSDGTWVLVYEANGNDSYSLRFLFHLLSAGILDFPTLLTADIDGDGKKEFVIFSGAYLQVFNSRQDNDYSLLYLKREIVDRGGRHSVQLYDFDHNGIKDLLISKSQEDTVGQRFRFFADVYRGTSLVHVAESEGKPRFVRLLQNYPNPFNPTTTINYQIPKDGMVSLKVFNLLGQEVATLVNEIKDAGFKSVTFSAKGGSASGGDGSKLSSGVYIYTLKAGSFMASKKLLLVK